MEADIDLWAKWAGIVSAGFTVGAAVAAWRAVTTSGATFVLPVSKQVDMDIDDTGHFEWAEDLLRKFPPRAIEQS